MHDARTPMPIPETLPHREKFEVLLGRFRQMGSALIAYSGGIDSSMLLKAGTLALGDRCLGVIARSETLTDEEYVAACKVAQAHGFHLETIAYSELGIENYAENPNNRCYFCKHELFTRLTMLARERKIGTIVEGSNADDVDDWRPGMKAARDLNVVSPLREAGLAKAEIRAIAQALGLPNWDKPSAPCLSSRIAYGVRIDRTKLDQVAGGEAFLREQGFRILRVRHHDDIGRIEVAPEEMDRLLEPAMRRRVADHMKGLGFRYVAVDLMGYRTGSLNEGFHTPGASADE